MSTRYLQERGIIGFILGCPISSLGMKEHDIRMPELVHPQNVRLQNVRFESVRFPILLFNKCIKFKNRTFWRFSIYGCFETGRFETWRFVNLTFCKLEVLKSDVLKPDVLKPDVLKPDVLWVYPKNGGLPCWRARMPRNASSASLGFSGKDDWGELPIYLQHLTLRPKYTYMGLYDSLKVKTSTYCQINPLQGNLSDYKIFF